MKLTKNADLDKCRYSDNGIRLDKGSHFSLPDGGFGKNDVIFSADMSWFVYVNKKKNILVFGEGQTQGFNDTTVTAETKYAIDLTQSRERFALNLYHNGSNSFLFVNAVNMYQFKAKDSQTKPYPLCLGDRKTQTITRRKQSLKDMCMLFC